MNHSKNSHPEYRVLVLARPSDSICTYLPSWLHAQGCQFSVSATIFQAFGQLETESARQSVILITRPAMLSGDALSFALKHVPALKIIGWCDPGEQVSDRAFSQAAGYGVVQVSDLRQLGCVLGAFSRSISKPDTLAQTPVAADPNARLNYELSAEEVAMLLEVK